MARRRREAGDECHDPFCGALAAGLVGVLAFVAAPALAAAGGPQWTVTAVSLPTHFSPVAKPGEDTYKVTVANTGGASSEGPVEVTDELPQGLSLDAAGAYGENPLMKARPGRASAVSFGPVLTAVSSFPTRRCRLRSLWMCWRKRWRCRR